MKEFITDAVPSAMSDIRIDADTFIKLYNQGKCELLDIRMPFETAVWQLNFGLRIPADQLPQRLEELPKEKLILSPGGTSGTDGTPQRRQSQRSEDLRCPPNCFTTLFTSS